MITPDRPVYLDHHATTPLDPQVLDAMRPYLEAEFGNAASRTHVYGWRAEAAVESARAQVAAMVGAGAREIIFTSGATESDNLAIKGVAQRSPADRRHAVTTAIEHKAVLDSFGWLESQGWQVTYVDPDSDGVVAAEAVIAALRPDTAMVSVMAVNNEVGTRQPIRAIGAACEERGILMHTDAAQAGGRIELDVRTDGVHLMSLSAHKMHGPKGVGALYVRQRDPKVRLAPLIHGGGHERGMRSGTLNVPAIVGFGEAARLAIPELHAEGERRRALTDRLAARLTQAVPDLRIHGDHRHRIPGSLNLSLPGVDAEALMLALKDEVAVSSGSACMSATLAPSYVLRAMGVDEETANCSIRFGLGRFTTEAEIDFAAQRVAEEAVRLQALTPDWKIAAEG